MSFYVRNAIAKRPGLMSIRRCSSDVKTVKVEPAKNAEYKSPTAQLGATHKVNNLERYFLVWTKRYPSLTAVPAHVTQETMERCRNIVRIRVNLTLIVLCLCGSIAAMKSGKKAAERGESVQKANLDWHREYNAMKKSES